MLSLCTSQATGSSPAALPAPSLPGCLNQSSPLPLPEHLCLHALPLPKSHFCVKTAHSLFPNSLLFFPPLMCSRVPTQPGPVTAAFLSIPGGLSPHCQLLQFQTQLFSSVLRQMESLITFYRLGRVQKAIDSPCLSFRAAGPAQALAVHSAEEPCTVRAGCKPWPQAPTSVSEPTPNKERHRGQRPRPEVVGHTFSDGQHCLLGMS